MTNMQIQEKALNSSYKKRNLTASDTSGLVVTNKSGKIGTLVAKFHDFAWVIWYDKCIISNPKPATEHASDIFVIY